MSIGAEYIKLDNPIAIATDDGVIRLSDIKAQIEAEKKERDDVIVKKWEILLTREYIIEKIMEAQTKSQKRAILIQDYTSQDGTYLLNVLNESGLGRKLIVMLEGPLLLKCDISGQFELFITWEEPQKCCIII